MSVISKRSKAVAMLAMLAAPATALSAQQDYPPEAEAVTTVYGSLPDDLSGLPEGPEIEGIISAQSGNKVQVTTAEGADTVVAVGQATEIKASGGFLGLDRDTLARDALLNGLPVKVETVEWGGGLIASKIALENENLKTARMIHSGTAQGFAEQTAATEALKGRLGNLDQYNVKGTTNVNFDVGEAALSETAKADLCRTASQAEGMDNALMLVVGYTDSTGSQELNQALSEKRAERVVNYLQQACGWEPYRMLTPTGMSESNPVAPNTTVAGKAQNRRVAVNILVSKSVDGL